MVEATEKNNPNRNFRFPIHDRDRYPAHVTFQAIQTIPPTITDDLLSVARLLVATDDGNFETALPSAIQANSVRQNPGDDFTITAPYRKNQFLDNTKSKHRPIGKCKLFMPKGVSFNDGVAYDEFSLGRIGAIANVALESGQGVTGAAYEAAKGSVDSFTELFNYAGDTPDIARLAVSRLSHYGGRSIEGGVKSALKTTINPNKQVLFKEVNIREFSFTFKLIASSQYESEEIKNIIKFFRTELYPDDSIKLSVDGGEIPIGFKFPNHFNIVMKYRESDENVTIAHKLLPAYLVSMKTDYNPTGSGYHADGSVVEVDVTMNFRENRTLSKNDILDGF